MNPEHLDDFIVNELTDSCKFDHELSEKLDLLTPRERFNGFLESYRRTCEVIGMLRMAQQCGTLAESQKYAKAELELQESCEKYRAAIEGIVNAYRVLVNNPLTNPPEAK